MNTKPTRADSGVTSISRRKAITAVAGALVVLPIVGAAAAMPIEGRNDRRLFELIKQHKTLWDRRRAVWDRANKIWDRISKSPEWGVKVPFNLEGGGTLFNIESIAEIKEGEQRWHRLFGGDEKGHRAVDKVVADATSVFKVAEKARERIERESGYTALDQQGEKLSDALWEVENSIYRLRPNSPKALAAQLAFHIDDMERHDHEPWYTNGMDRTLLKNVAQTLRRLAMI